MKPKLQEDVLAAMQPLDQFASQAPLPRGWHAQWQAIFQQAVDNVQAVAAEKQVGNGQEPQT